MEKILPIWQPLGLSTHLISQRIGEKYGVKTSHTGTLDPMAEGVIIVLLDDLRLKKYEYAAWKKTYEFDIAFGISSDTYDGMGLIVEADLNTVTLDKRVLEKTLARFMGEYKQKVPAFSTKKIKGKHLHEYARDAAKVALPEKSGTIFGISLMGTEEKTLEQLVTDNIAKIEKVLGDFRQAQIVKEWKDLMHENSNKTIPVARISVQMSKGLYVRSLSQDICKKLGSHGFVFSLTRTENGEYNKGNSKTLEEIFGEDYLSKHDFVSRFKS